MNEYNWGVKVQEGSLSMKRYKSQNMLNSGLPYTQLHIFPGNRSVRSIEILLYLEL